MTSWMMPPRISCNSERWTLYSTPWFLPVIYPTTSVAELKKSSSHFFETNTSTWYSLLNSVIVKRWCKYNPTHKENSRVLSVSIPSLKKNSWYSATKRAPVSLRNDVWEMSPEISYWWRVNIQICEVLLIGRAKWDLLQPTRNTTQIWVVMLHQYGISALVSLTSFSVVAKCWLFSQAIQS